MVGNRHGVSSALLATQKVRGEDGQVFGGRWRCRESDGASVVSKWRCGSLEWSGLAEGDWRGQGRGFVLDAVYGLVTGTQKHWRVHVGGGFTAAV